MDIHLFYNDLAEWVMTINEMAAKLGPDDYWTYILTSAGALSKKHNDGELVKEVILAHVHFLEKAWKEREATQ